MNLAQTEQLLTFLWGKFPSARNLSIEDKQMTVLAYLDELWMFSLQDAINGARLALKEQPHFIPSAPEISCKCKKTLEPSRYMSSEYDGLAQKLLRLEMRLSEFELYHIKDDAVDNYNRHINSHRGQRLTPEESQERAELREAFEAEHQRFDESLEEYEQIKSECQRLKKARIKLEEDAFYAALSAYDREQRSLALEDLKLLGYTPMSMTLEG